MDLSNSANAMLPLLGGGEESCSTRPRVGILALIRHSPESFSRVLKTVLKYMSCHTSMVRRRRARLRFGLDAPPSLANST